MYSRNLFVLDFVRRFFVSCVQIFEAYALRTLMKFGCDWHKNQPQNQVQERLREYIKITEEEKQEENKTTTLVALIFYWRTHYPSTKSQC